MSGYSNLDTETLRKIQRIAAQAFVLFDEEDRTEAAENAKEVFQDINEELASRKGADDD
jgi:uncharacterized protein YecE (DUF72 family)